ncbi:MAG: hypothetical protein ACRD4S_16930 [Candidatus Acidiferrales bacterium]
MAVTATRKIKLTRAVIVKGHGHCSVGDIFEVPRHLAAVLIGQDCAIAADDEKSSYSVNIESPQHGDPAPRRTQAAPQVKKS